MAPFDSNGKFIPPIDIDLGEVTSPVISDNPRSTYRLDKDDPKRIAKLKSCMMEWLVFDKYNGIFKYVHRPCGYHECPICSKLYAKRYRERIADSGAVYCLITDRETATNICRVMKNKYCYLRMPTETDDYVFFRLDEAYKDNVEFIALSADKFLMTPEIIEATPFEELQAVPEDRRISGKLGLSPAMEEDEETVIINQPFVRIISNVEVERKQRAVLTAMTYTVSESPKTAAELQESLYRRTNAYTDALDADGIKYEMLFAKQKINLKKLSWWQSTIYTLEMVLGFGVKAGSKLIGRIKQLVASWGELGKKRIEIYLSSLSANKNDDIALQLRALLT